MPLPVYGRVDLVIEHILQLFEEALTLFVVFFFQRTLKFFQGIALRLVQLFGDLHLALDVHIAAATAVQVLDTLAAQAEGGAALGALGHGVLHLAVNGGHGDAVAQHRLTVSDGHGDPYIVAVALEHLAGAHRDHDDHITGRTAVGTGIAHAAQCKALVVVDAHGDGHLQRLFGSHLAAAVADLAGVLYQLALAAAAGAGLLGLHHAKGGALLADHEAAAAAVRAGLGAGTGGTAAAVALGALLLAGDGDVLLAAVHGLVKTQGDAHPDVLPLAGGVGVCLTGRAAKTAETAEGPVIAYGSLLIGETTPGDAMTTVEIPIEYYDRTTKPTGAYTLVISCTTSAYGDFMAGCKSNVLYVDNFEWVY